jgi:hypothetical protein
MTPRRPPHDITDAEKQAKAMVRNMAPVTSLDFSRKSL